MEIILKPSARKPTVLILDSLHQMSMERKNWQINARSQFWRPPTDVYEVGGSIVVRVEIAGMDESDFSIVLDGNTLIVRGFRPDTPERRGYHQMEIRFGEFLSEVNLPYQVDMDKIEAIYSNGFLKITLPPAQSTKVPIKEE